MEELTNQMLEDIKRDQQITDRDDIKDLDTLDLNSLFTFGINFDMLKLVINNLIKSIHRINSKLAEIKLEKINAQQRTDQIEISLLDLQIDNEKLFKAKNSLQDKKSKLLSKNYKNDINMALKEKEYFTNSLENMNKNESYKIDKILDNIRKFNLGGNKKTAEEIEKKLEEYNSKLKEENKANKEDIEKFKNNINLNISTKIEELTNKLEEAKSKMLFNDKEFLLMKQTIKNTEEKLDKNISKEMPELIEKIFSDKISLFNTGIEQIKTDNEKSLKKVGDNLRENMNKMQKFIDDKNLEFENKINKIKLGENTLSENMKILTNETLKEFVPLKSYKQSQIQLEEKLLSDKNQQHAEMDALNANISALKNQFNEFTSDQTDHNNLNILMKKYESSQAIIYKAQEMMDDYEKEKKRYQNIDPKKIVLSDIFDEFKNNINKIIINFHQSFDEMKNDILEKNSKFLGNQATLRDLKNLEDDFITKLDELYNSINDKFAEKNLILRNNKAMELKMKRIVEDSKKNEKSDSWLLSKMPIGHLCASCESYLGDIKDTANTKYVPWNKYPTKENADKLYRVGAGYSRMLQMISPDAKNKTKASNNSNNYESLSPIGIGSRQDIIEDMNEISKNKYLNNSINSNSLNHDINTDKKNQTSDKMPFARYKLPNLLKVKHLQKNSTFSNFYSENIEEQNKNKIINNSTKGFNIIQKSLNQNNKGNISNKNKNEDSEKDEIIISPSSREIKPVKDEDNKNGPKILKVVKKK